MREHRQDIFWKKGKGNNEAQIIPPDKDEPYEGEGWVGVQDPKQLSPEDELIAAEEPKEDE